MKWEIAADNIRKALKEYVSKAGLKCLVIGESGGIDSALTTVLARTVCDELGIPLIGRSITIETNTSDEISRAKAIGEAFCHDFKEVDLTSLYVMNRDTMEEGSVEDPSSKEYKLRVGNIKARMRMIYLYNLAQKHRGMVLSTDNQTEYMLGFWTLHGDVGDFDPLFGLWKTEVYAIAHAEYSKLTEPKQIEALKRCIDCIPTDGLGITSSDVEQLGAKDYTEVDSALIRYLEKGIDDINQKVVARHIASDFKRKNPILLERKVIFSHIDE